MVDDVAGILRELIRANDVWGVAAEWGATTMVVGSQDVHTAFDEVSH